MSKNKQRKGRGLAKGMEEKIEMARGLLAYNPKMKLAKLCEHIGVSLGTAHSIKHKIVGGKK